MGNFSCKSQEDTEQSTKKPTVSTKPKAQKSAKKAKKNSMSKPEKKNVEKQSSTDSLGLRRRHYKKHSQQKNLCNIIKKEKNMFDGKVVNPKTIRLINQDGRTMKQIQQGCNKFQKDNVRKFLQKEETIQTQEKVVNPKSTRKINIKKRTFKDLTKK